MAKRDKTTADLLEEATVSDESVPEAVSDSVVEPPASPAEPVPEAVSDSVVEPPASPAEPVPEPAPCIEPIGPSPTELAAEARAQAIAAAKDAEAMVAQAHASAKAAEAALLAAKAAVVALEPPPVAEPDPYWRVTTADHVDIVQAISAKEAWAAACDRNKLWPSPHKGKVERVTADGG